MGNLGNRNEASASLDILQILLLLEKPSVHRFSQLPLWIQEFVTSKKSSVQFPTADTFSVHKYTKLNQTKHNQIGLWHQSYVKI